MSGTATPEREADRYPHVLRAVLETPWAIRPEALEVIREIIQMRVAGERFSEEEIEARVGGRTASVESQVSGNVAIIPVYGTIIPRASLFSDISGGTSLEALATDLRAAVADESVQSIVLDINSPGGLADMLPEFAAEMRSLKGTKPIVASANLQAASAAYWIGSQADEFVVTKSGEVGSIGVFAAHTDISAMEEKLGRKTTVVQSTGSPHKTEFSPYGPLSDDAKAEIQARVDETYGMFVADVAKGRGVTVDAVRKDYGKGRVLSAKKALEAGMVDRIETLRETVQRLSRPAKPTSATAAVPDDPARVSVVFTGNTTTLGAGEGPAFTDEADALRDSAGALVDRLSSLAEVERGSLTRAKRESLVACPAALRESADAIEQVLARTEPEREDEGDGLDLEFAFQSLRH